MCIVHVLDMIQIFGLKYTLYNIHIGFYAKITVKNQSYNLERHNW